MKRPNRNRLVAAALAGAGFAVFSLAPLPAMAEGSIVIRDFVLSHSIDQREPVDTTDFFRVDDGKAFAFARIHNTGAPTAVSFVWYYGDANHAIVSMNVGTSPGWRTWSTANLRAGNWRVELVDAEGAVLAERRFTVGHGSTAPVAGEMDGMPDDRGDMSRSFHDPVEEEIPASVTYPMR